jgi:hypothetical protein
MQRSRYIVDVQPTPGHQKESLKSWNGSKIRETLMKWADLCLKTSHFEKHRENG